MSNNNVKALKSGVWYTAANFLTKSIGLITTPIFTRLLTHAEFGLYSNYTSWLSILSLIVTLNLESTFISARYDYEKKFDNYIFSVLSLSSLSVIVWTALLNIIFTFFPSFFGMDRLYLNCMLIYLLFLPAVNMYQTRERYYFEYKRSVIISLIVSVGTSLISVLLVVNLSNRLTGRILGSAIVTILVGIVLYIIIFIKGRTIDVRTWKYAFPICLPFIPHLLSMVLLGSLDRIMITRICGEEDNALYSLAYNCGSIISILITSLNTAFSPWLGSKLNSKSYKEINAFSKLYISIFMYLSLGAMLLTPELLLILGGKSYMHAIYVMPPITCGISCQFLYTMFVNVEQFNKKTVGMAIGSISAAILNYLLNLLFIPKFGYIAAAYTTLIGYLWLLAVHMFLVKKIGYSHVYDYKFVVKIVLFMLSITVLINYIYRYTIIRYIVVFIYLCISIIIAIKYRNTIIGKIKELKKEKQ